MAGSMIERMARVIDPNAWAHENTFDSKAWEGFRASSLDRACQILAEMRRPTVTMVEAGDMTAEGHCDCLHAQTVWPAMIDAALEEVA